MLEIKAKIAKDTYKTLIETGALKPETLTTPVLEVIAKKLEIKFETLVFGGTMIAQDYDTFHKFDPGEYQPLKLPPREGKEALRSVTNPESRSRNTTATPAIR